MPGSGQGCSHRWTWTVLHTSQCAVMPCRPVTRLRAGQPGCPRRMSSYSCSWRSPGPWCHPGKRVPSHPPPGSARSALARHTHSEDRGGGAVAILGAGGALRWPYDGVGRWPTRLCCGWAGRRQRAFRASNGALRPLSGCQVPAGSPEAVSGVQVQDPVRAGRGESSLRSYTSVACASVAKPAVSGMGRRVPPPVKVTAGGPPSGETRGGSPR